MRILLVGGGTGGHITPLLAVAHELKKSSPNCHITYVGERNGKFHALTKNAADFDQTHYIFAGKFRRYHGESIWQKLTDFRTLFLNLRDVFYVTIGFFQAFILLGNAKPDVIFIKGGFVGVPVGLAAALRRRRFVTHDSDTVPGLANRIIGRWAAIHATGMPAELYPYPKSRTRYVGVPISENYKTLSDKEKSDLRDLLNVPEDAEVILVTGGSQGAVKLNNAVRHVVEILLTTRPNLHILHQVGAGNREVYHRMPSNTRLHVFEFTPDMYQYSGAADVVVSRASATTVSELATQQKAVILVPSPVLAGGHQLQNAAYLAEHDAAIVLPENDLIKDPTELVRALELLLNDGHRRRQLGAALHSITKQQAAHAIAVLLIEVVNGSSKGN